MPNPYGIAVRITPENFTHIKILTGITPYPPKPNKPTYFVYPYDYDARCEILPAKKFFKKYAFANTEDPTCMVEINKY